MHVYITMDRPPECDSRTLLVLLFTFILSISSVLTDV